MAIIWDISPNRINLTLERSVIKNDRTDLAYIKVESAGESEGLIPDSDMQIEFETNGDGD